MAPHAETRASGGLVQRQRRPRELNAGDVVDIAVALLARCARALRLRWWPTRPLTAVIAVPVLALALGGLEGWAPRCAQLLQPRGTLSDAAVQRCLETRVGSRRLTSRLSTRCSPTSCTATGSRGSPQPDGRVALDAPRRQVLKSHVAVLRAATPSDREQMEDATRRPRLVAAREVCDCSPGKPRPPPAVSRTSVPQRGGRLVAFFQMLGDQGLQGAAPLAALARRGERHATVGG